MQADGKLNPQAAAGKNAVTPLSGRNDERGIFACLLCAELACIARGDIFVPALSAV